MCSARGCKAVLHLDIFVVPIVISSALWCSHTVKPPRYAHSRTRCQIDEHGGAGQRRLVGVSPVMYVRTHDKTGTARTGEVQLASWSQGD